MWPRSQTLLLVVIAWLWLDMALALGSRADAFAIGKRTAMRFFFAFELPRVEIWLEIVAARSTLCRDMPVDAF